MMQREPNKEIYLLIVTMKTKSRFANFRCKENEEKNSTKRKTRLSTICKSCFDEIIRIKLIFLSATVECAVKRFNRTKTRNKMASRANKEKRKKSTATPIVMQHTEHVHQSLIAHDDPHLI